MQERYLSLPQFCLGTLWDKAGACEIQKVRVQLSSHNRVNNPPKRAKLARGFTSSGYQKRAGPEAPCPPRSPSTRFPPRFQAGPREAEAEAEEGQEAAASCPGASGRAEREGRHTPSPAAATPGLCRRAGGQGPRLAPASLGRLPAPPRGGRQMGRPPAQRRRQEAAAGAAWNAAAGGGGRGPD